ncbi:cytochrome c oxidase subunit 2 [Tanacetum coccineum]
MSFLVGPTGEISLPKLEEQEQVSPFFGGAEQLKNETYQMIVLEWLFLTIAPCDAVEPWQLGSQDARTPMMQGTIDLHHDIFFFLILILVFVSRILYHLDVHCYTIIYSLILNGRGSSKSSYYDVVRLCGNMSQCQQKEGGDGRLYSESIPELDSAKMIIIAGSSDNIASTEMVD